MDTALPQIAGTPKAGETLTCSTGSWSPAPTAPYAYQWDLDGLPIEGATASELVVQPSDEGHTLTCTVTAADGAGAGAGTGTGVGVGVGTGVGPGPVSGGNAAITAAGIGMPPTPTHFAACVTMCLPLLSSPVAGLNCRALNTTKPCGCTLAR